MVRILVFKLRHNLFDEQMKYQFIDRMGYPLDQKISTCVGIAKDQSDPAIRRTRGVSISKQAAWQYRLKRTVT
jgi:hypothetical protein